MFGVSLTISGLLVAGRTRATTRSSSAGTAPMSRPVATLGHETFSSTAAISERSSQAAVSSASSSPVEPMTFVISGTGSSASCGRSCSR